LDYNPSQPRDLLKNRHSQLTPSQGTLKEGDVDDDADDDDEVRTSESQNHATATLSTEEFFFSIYSSLLIPGESWGKEGDRKNRWSTQYL
jgi:hypothetical protein